MKVYGFEVKVSGFMYNNLSRNEVLSYLKPLIENRSVGMSYEWQRMTFPEKCALVIKAHGLDTIFINSVHGAYLSEGV
jgi:hypothetical protein